MEQATGRILVVSSHRELASVVRTLLEREGHKIHSVSGTEEATARITEALPDVVIADSTFSTREVIPFVRQIRAERALQNLMIVLLVPKGMPQDRIAGYEAGANDCIEKPFHRREFLARINAALRTKQLSDELSERNARLIASQRALIQREKMATVGLLAGGIAHEFTNIMNGIAACAQLAERDRRHADQLIDAVLTQSRRAGDILDSLRTFVQPHALSFVPVDLSRLLNDVLCLVRKEAQRRSVSLKCTVAQGTPPVRGIPGQLQQILLNLLLNAIQATQKGGAVTVSARACGDTVLLEVTDTGCGIPPHLLRRIFDPFFTTKGSLGGGSGGGTGLGLTVVQNLLRLHNGTLEVTSRPAKGSTFSVRLPTACAPSAQAPEGAVLFVSASPRQRRAFQEACGAVPVRAVASVPEALEIVGRHCLRAALVDLDSVNRHEANLLLVTLREADPAVLLACVASDTPEEALLHVVDQVLPAPVQKSALANLLFAACCGIPEYRSGLSCSRTASDKHPAPS